MSDDTYKGLVILLLLCMVMTMKQMTCAIEETGDRMVSQVRSSLWDVGKCAEK